jgi:LysR family transcriptional regulator, glycine cleavage system transcriptional activator
MLNENHRKIAIYLNALRAFEAAARLHTFVAAAAELNVSPSAISQLVKTLEDYVGRPLFLRSRTGVTPTREAELAYRPIRDGFALLIEGLQRLGRPDTPNIVTMSVTPAFAGKWLLPRIESFRAAHPRLDIRLDTTNRLVDYYTEGIDIGVRYGVGQYPGLQAERLMGEDIFPVCSPKLLDILGKPSIGLDDLREITLIHDATFEFDPTFPSWITWLAARGVRVEEPMRGGLHMNSSALAIQAAIAGQGIALGRSQLIEADLSAGLLIKPFGEQQVSRCAYYVVYPQRSSLATPVKAVRDWLLKETMDSHVA